MNSVIDPLCENKISKCFTVFDVITGEILIVNEIPLRSRSDWESGVNKLLMPIRGNLQPRYDINGNYIGYTKDDTGIIYEIEVIKKRSLFGLFSVKHKYKYKGVDIAHYQVGKIVYCGDVVKLDKEGEVIK